MLLDQTKEIQSRFGTYCRNGEEVEIEGARKDRLKYYRQLVFNVVNDTLQDAYPISVSYLGEEIFTELVNDFFSNHNCESNQVWKLPFEFYTYHSEKTRDDFLKELMLFEWTETELFSMEDKMIPSFNANGNLHSERIIINPEYKLMHFHYPLHLMKPELAKEQPGNYFLLAFRHPEKKNIPVINLSPLHVFCIEKYSEGYTLNLIASDAADLFNAQKPAVEEHLLQFTKDMNQQGFVLGTKIN